MGGDTDKAVTEPSFPYPAEQFRDPSEGPDNGAIWEKKPHVPSPGDSLEDVAGDSFAGEGITVRELIDFEWGARSRAEANWYLREYNACTSQDAAGNYGFDNAIYPGARTIDQWLWLPVPEEQVHPAKKVAGTRGEKFTLNTTSCPLQGKASRSPKSKNAGLLCRYSGPTPPPCAGPMQDKWTQVDMGLRWQALTPLIERLLDSRGLLLTFHRYDILEKSPLGERAHQSIAVEELSLDFLGDEESRTFEELETLGSGDPQRPRSALSADPSGGKIDWTGVSNPRELAFAAEHIRLLQDAGQLRSVTIRGFADAVASRAHNIELSWTRANWVYAALRDGLGLLAAVPVNLVGCGEHHAESMPVKGNPGHRVVVVELETGPPEESEIDKEVHDALQSIDKEGAVRLSYQDFRLVKSSGWTASTADSAQFADFRFLEAEGISVPQIHYQAAESVLNTVPIPQDVDRHGKVIREVGRAFFTLLEDVVGRANRAWLSEMDQYNYLAYMRRRLDSWQPNYNITTLGTALRIPNWPAQNKPVPGENPRLWSLRCAQERAAARQKWMNQYHARYKEVTKPDQLISFYVAVDDALEKRIKEMLREPYALHIPPLKIHFETNRPKVSS